MEDIAKNEGNLDQYNFLSYLHSENILPKTNNLAQKAQQSFHPLVSPMADAQKEVLSSLAS